MFEAAELGHKISKSVYKKEEPKIREQLLEAQLSLKENPRFPVIILISGVDGGGKGETINQLYEWMDPRFISTLAFTSPTEEEKERPFMWRFWRDLPPSGRVGIFSGSWYSTPISDKISKISSRAEFDQRLDAINRFEEMLVNEEALVLKFWFHLSKGAQKKRLNNLAKDPRTAWRVNKESWARLKTYDDLQKVAGHLLRTTNKPWAPWTIVEGTNDRYRNMTVAKMVLEAIQKKLAKKTTVKRSYPVAASLTRTVDSCDVLTSLKLMQKLSKEDYLKDLAKYQGQLSELVQKAKFKKMSVVMVFEGSDAAGKGGAIRRMVAAMDARQYQIVPIAAPTQEEKAHPYLWRFWKYLPRHGRMTIFDRSWYGRVLVERVEKFCSENDWLRAYSEINDFEHEIANTTNLIVIKFWLQVSKEEQLRRFKEREVIKFKQYKITDEDWRNREKWDEYHQAICEMVERTSTGHAPWTLVEADNKNYARVKVLKTVCERLKKALD